MNHQNESNISPRWEGYRKFWLFIAILLFLLLLLLAALGYGPNGKNCQIPPKTVEVEKLIDNPANIQRIATLEKENAAIAGLQAKIKELENAEPKVVEKVVEKIVDNPEQLKRIGILEAENALLAELKKKVAMFESAEPKVVEKLVDNPEQLKRIKELETENASIAGLKEKIKELENAEPKVIEKEVEKIVDNPEQLKRITELEKENMQIPILQEKLKALETAEPKVIEKVVEKVVTKKSLGSRLFFKSGSYRLPSNSQLYLSATVNYLKSHPSAKVSVAGFHDESGILTANQLLATQRAQMVKKQLIRSGIAEDRIIISQPTVAKGTGRAAEARRVEVDIID